jgi:hypothetical protein
MLHIPDYRLRTNQLLVAPYAISALPALLYPGRGSCLYPDIQSCFLHSFPRMFFVTQEVA